MPRTWQGSERTVIPSGAHDNCTPCRSQSDATATSDIARSAARRTPGRCANFAYPGSCQSAATERCDRRDPAGPLWS